MSSPYNPQPAHLNWVSEISGQVSEYSPNFNWYTGPSDESQSHSAPLGESSNGGDRYTGNWCDRWYDRWYGNRNGNRYDNWYGSRGAHWYDNWYCDCNGSPYANLS